MARFITSRARHQARAIPAGSIFSTPPGRHQSSSSKLPVDPSVGLCTRKASQLPAERSFKSRQAVSWVTGNMSDVQHPAPSPDSEGKMTDVEKAPFDAERHDNVPDVAAKERAEAFITPTPKEERDVIRKLDWRLMPIVFILYMLSVLDRSNLGNARLAGLEDDIDLSGFRYNWLGTLFYIAYIFSQWLLMGWKQFPPYATPTKLPYK
ncbi:uncharacterized protein LTR77_005521 [Saxophila tyrrhenica]|uniref:Uncharacterized protein n=1 Tax=Saxophila tyrrhenica TaxID=1690608 RepID=A0AAV9P9D7_9PEZI|nr:hypothetical protein LTR77_005521 [Saxophila tyrrhenica]